MKETKVVVGNLNYNFECDWLIYATILNVIGLLNCPITIKLSDNNLASESVENRNFLNQSQSWKLYFFYD